MALLSTAFARRTLALMLSGLLVLLVIVGVSLWLSIRATGLSRDVSQAVELRALSADVLAFLQDAETGQRGFLLTSDPRYLEPYEKARPALDKEIARLRALFVSDPMIGQASDRLSALIASKLEELAETTELARAGERDAALRIVRTDRGRIVMDELRAVLGRLVDNADDRLTARLAEMQESTRALSWAVGAGAALILIFACGAIWTVLRHLRGLQAARREVDHLNATLELRVKARTTDLSEANKEVQRFAYVVTHDLRAPLVNIMGFAGELEATAKTLRAFMAEAAPGEQLTREARLAAEEDLPEAVHFIKASTTKMDGLINAILKLSRQGRSRITPEPVDLEAVLKAASGAVQHQLTEAGGRIEIAPRMPALVSDRLALEQVFGNVVENAVKYLAPGRPGVIAVSGEERDGRVRVSIADNGRGIDPRDHERIFELFRRSGEQDKPGEGIGLAHVRLLARRLGGDISVASKLGEGSTFIVDLPKVSPDAGRRTQDA